MREGNVDVLRLRARGKAKLIERAGIVTLNADDPVSALQAIARQASIRIDLTVGEAEQLGKAGRLGISLDYASDVSGASEAAQNILLLVGRAHDAGEQRTSGGWKIFGFLSLLLLIGAAVFILTYRMLESAYG